MANELDKLKEKSESSNTKRSWPIIDDLKVAWVVGKPRVTYSQSTKFRLGSHKGILPRRNTELMLSQVLRHTMDVLHMLLHCASVNENIIDVRDEKPVNIVM